MNASEPLSNGAGLTSPSPNDRARAATWLVLNPQAISTRELMQALQTETVPRVRTTLLVVLEKRKGLIFPRVNSSDHKDTRADHPPRDLPDHVDIAALIRHELSPAVGWISLAADDEIPDFESSKTQEAVNKLQRRINGLVAMIKSSQELNLRRLVLPQAIIDNWPDSLSAPEITPHSSPARLEIETDEGLFSILLSNALQNAIDASRDAVGEPAAQISWGYTDQNYWVRIVNPFKGNQFTLADVVGVGSTSKPSHQGHGLSLVETVANRLGIAINLEGHSGTASFTISGKRPSE